VVVLEALMGCPWCCNVEGIPKVAGVGYCTSTCRVLVLYRPQYSVADFAGNGVSSLTSAQRFYRCIKIMIRPNDFSNPIRNHMLEKPFASMFSMSTEFHVLLVELETPF
jgi:hypothetical protein